MEFEFPSDIFQLIKEFTFDVELMEILKTRKKMKRLATKLDNFVTFGSVTPHSEILGIDRYLQFRTLTKSNFDRDYDDSDDGSFNSLMFFKYSCIFSKRYKWMDSKRFHIRKYFGNRIVVWLKYK